MTIFEAIKSGVPFRRPDGDWIRNTWNEATQTELHPEQIGVSIGDIMADDWLIKTKPDESVSK